MKHSKKIVSLLGAAVLLTDALPASAETDGIKYVYVNRPYLNVTFDTEGFDPRELAPYVISDESGEAVAVGRVGEPTLDHSSFYDMSLMRSIEDVWDTKGARFIGYGTYKPDEGKKLLTYRKEEMEAEENGEYGVELCKAYYCEYKPDVYGEVLDTMTLEPNTVEIFVDKKFGTNNDDFTCMSLSPYDDYADCVSEYPNGKQLWPCDHWGEKFKFSADAGMYNLDLNKIEKADSKRTDWDGDAPVKVSDEPVEYVKIRLNVWEDFPDFADLYPDGVPDRAVYYGTHIDPVSGEAVESWADFNMLGNMELFVTDTFFVSGSVINAVYPDEKGNVELWVDPSADDVYLRYAFSARPEVPGGGFVNGGSTAERKRREQIYTAFDFPLSGHTLYDIRPGDYTVTFEDKYTNRNFKIMNGGFNVENTQELQKARIKVTQRKLIPGDCNDDGEVDVTDVMLAAAEVKSLRPLDHVGFAAADINDNTFVEVTDLMSIAAHVKGLANLPDEF
ncbi:dockerin type I repeat-containing protein [Ruminococcus sp.]|uniref:dockerin type I repeat-containing protein n=1 Tax=Ruminococcus sp. TaxID=41978 RepID=UPI0025F249AE|nr:dockerin type I repeat-containing protein [Ruminococcus sp.]MBQ8965769.1 dockerin type I repeat-containing protein [Ruminococcus sp.]